MATDPKKLKRAERLLRVNDSPAAVIDFVEELEAEIEKINKSIPMLHQIMETVKGTKGDPGEKGESITGPAGPQGESIVGPMGPEGPQGPKGDRGDDPDYAFIVSSVMGQIRMPKDGKDGRDGKDAKDLTSVDIREKLEALKGDERLPASAIKDLDKYIKGKQPMFFQGGSYGVKEIVAGTNVTVSKDQNNVYTINATGGGGGGSGDVVGPASSIDNEIPRYDGVTGKLLQGSTYLITDTGVITVSGANQNIQLLPTGTGKFLIGPTLTTDGAFVHDQTAANKWFAIYDADNSRYYGISKSLPSPAGTSTLGGYYYGLGVGGGINTGDNPIFGVLNSSQSTNGIGQVAFTIYANNKIVTFNSTLDDGDGDMTIAGTIAAEELTLTTDLAIAHGGTGASTAQAARLALLPAVATHAGKFLRVNAGETDVEWATPAGGGSGDFVGPASATDNAVVRFDGTTGKLGQNSVVLIEDTGAVTGVLSMVASGAAAFIQVTNTTDAASNQVAIFEGDRATMADNDEAYITYRLSNDAGTQVEVARMSWIFTDVNVATSVDSSIAWSTINAGTLAKRLTLNGTSLAPTTNDLIALGTTTLGWADLHLATGAVIRIANTNWVATHTSGILTVGTGDLRVTTAGTNTASVVTVGGTQTLTNKTLTSPTIGTSIVAGSASMAIFDTTATTVTAFGATTTLTIGGTPTAAITHNYSTNATASAATKTINFGTGGAAGSTTNINIGSSVAGTTTINSPVVAITSIELGHASDTTIARSAAGQITIEGVQVVTVSNTVTLTNKTLTSPVINVTSDATGDIYYRSAGGLFTRLGIGSAGQVLTVASGLPSWAAAGGGGSSKPQWALPIAEGFNGTMTTTGNHRTLNMSNANYSYWETAMPSTYAGGGLTVDIYFAIDSDTDGGHTASWEMGIMRHVADTDDLDVDSFAADQSSTTFAHLTSARLTRKRTITFTNGAQMDSWTAGESATIRLRHSGSVSGTVMLIAVVIRET